MILDRGLLRGEKLFAVARQALAGGAEMLQVRNKTADGLTMLADARRLNRIAHRRDVPCIINDNVGVAIASRADGLHIGKGDIDARLARRLMGRRALIGVSAGRYSDAVRAKSAGADYLGLGPVFATPIKRSRRPIGAGVVRRVTRLGMPVFAIGGIDHTRIARLRAMGCRACAVIRAVSAASDPYRATKRLRKALVS